MPKYYVAGIPFDSEDCLKHYGVKGMKWNQHIFGIDANDKYINWLKDAGQNIGKFANKAANAVGNAATSAARATGGVLNKSANFVTGNQARENLNAANANVANVQSGRSKVNDAYARYNQLKKSEVQHRRTADGWRDSLSKRAPLENFGRNQDRINADNEDRRANRDANRAEIAKMKADRMAERQRNAETQARAEAKNAQQAYDRTLPGAAENAARGAQGFLNSAGKWVSTAANNVGQTVGNAANQAGQWIGDRANDIGKAATNAYNDVSKAVSGNGVEADVSERIAKKYGLNSVEDVLAMDRATAEKMLQERDAEISKAKDNSLFGRIGNAANSVGNWFGDRAKDVGNMATDAWNGVTDAANQAGDWIGDRARDVGNVATDAWNGVSGAANQAGQWLGDRANDVGKAAGSAVNAVGNAANDAGQWIGDRAKEAGEAIGNAANGAREWVGNAAKDVRDFVSEMENPHIQIDAEKVKENYRNYLNEHPENPQSPKHEEWLKEQIKNDPQLREYYESQIKEQKAPENYDDRIRTSGSSLSSAKTASERETVLRDLVSAIDSEKGFGGGSDFQNDTPMSYWAERAKHNFDEIDNLERALKYEDDPNSEHYRRLKKDLDYYRIDNDILTGEFYQNPNAAGKFGPGNINYNNKPDNVSQENWDYYCGENYGVGPLANLYGMSMREREDYDRQHFRHSALSDKPEGVGEAFWKNYIAHGGTREDYERDWR